MASGTVAILIYGVLHLVIYGLRPTRYMELSAAYGLKLAWLPWKAYVLIVEPQPWFPAGLSLLALCPWMILGAAGMLVTIACRPDRRLAAFTIILPMLAYAATMLAYVDLLPPGLWRYGNIHYFKWLLPLFALFALVFVRGLKAFPRASLATFAWVLLAASIRLVPVEAKPDEPARALVFQALPGEFGKIYMARSIITDRAGMVRNTVEYHQVQRVHGVWAIAQTRDFAGEERWLPDAPPSVAWPAGNGARPAPGIMTGGALPLHRYRIGWEIGAPCWLPPYACAASD
ncbi:hypothetical protein [Sphingomonas sp.]|uniref:hypothetical protein n=1 Tax=Sphingomonas sp. TaxID=28214 RepID=UPI000DB4DED5|nr:hypothetical protein [Sphingomonas sp.]PZU10826.1 MAG: hypothetical protein DI605_04110 [Sphingomonas sp.]